LLVVRLLSSPNMSRSWAVSFLRSSLLFRLKATSDRSSHTSRSLRQFQFEGVVR